jgi:polyhydroxybutyrate depolymerase
VLAVAGCGSAGTGQAAGNAGTSATQVPVGDSTQTISVGGTSRTFHVYRPAVLSHRAPLVVVLHGGFGSGTQAEKSYGWDGQADAGQFIVAYPDGLNRAWNTGGGCCGKPASNHVDDVGFLSQMVSTLERETAIDHTRVYATGISNGGIMAYSLACQTTLFAAIGPDSATQLGPCAAPSPTSVIHIHGTADRTIPYAGGPGQGHGAAIDGPAVPALNATWRQIDRCAPPVVVTTEVVTTSTADCPGGRNVVLITIAGAGHQWPGSSPDPAALKLLHADPPSSALNATDVIWHFLSQHHQ